MPHIHVGRAEENRDIGEQGGIDSGVGRTALMVAAARAIETYRPDALARDAHAEHFVRGSRASAAWPVRLDQVPDGDADPLWGRLARYFGLRTRVLDDFVRNSILGGARQTVVFGAGLDTRAYRLDWPSDSIVYEIDRAPVLAFKQDVLDRRAVTAAAVRRPLAADLRSDWAAALLAGGFDPAQPTTWLAEGVLLYLPGAVERRLLDTVHSLSAPGSTLAYEVKPLADAPTSPTYTATLRHTGIDLLALFATGPRQDSAARLTAGGWSVTVHTPYEFTRIHGRGPLPQENDSLASNRWVFAHLPSM